MFVIGEEEVQAVRRVIESGQLFRYQGDQESETGAFEREWAEMIGTKHALAVTSGTAALICALAGLGIGPGDEVIVPAYTFIATALAPLAVGAIPVIAEVDDSLTIDPADLERKITPRTKAVIPVHMNGLPCNMDAVRAIADSHGLYIVEDACQADGGSYKGKRHGSASHAGAFSFNYFKIITAGEGGAMVTNEMDVYARAVIHHDGGCGFFSPESKERGVMYFAGGNFRFNEIASAILRVQLQRLDGILSSLRAEKRLLTESLSGETAFRLSPVNDVDGDCSIGLMLLMDSPDQTDPFMAELNREGGVCYSPRDSDRHIYTNWEPVLKQQGAHHPGRDAFRSSTVPMEYSADMCPQTLSVLSRTVCVFTDPKRSRDESLLLADRIRRAGKAIS